MRLRYDLDGPSQYVEWLTAIGVQFATSALLVQHGWLAAMSSVIVPMLTKRRLSHSCQCRAMQMTRPSSHCLRLDCVGPAAAAAQS